MGALLRVLRHCGRVVAPTVLIALVVGTPVTGRAPGSVAAGVTLDGRAGARATPPPQQGTAVADGPLTGDRTYRRMVAARYDNVTPENAMKWSEIHPGPDRYDFAAGDRLVRFARRRDQAVHGHVLVWHQQNPEWLTSGTFTRDELVGILRDHVRSVVRHYRGRVAEWDVVNEAVDENGELRRTLWLDGIGPEYLGIAFRAAHRADPSARLFYNDYGAEVAGPKRDGVNSLLQGLVDRGIPIDGVGLQMHTTTATPPADVDPPIGAQFFRPRPAKLADTMAGYDAMGLVVGITEMDVRLRIPADASALATQAAVYREVWRTCVRAPNCTGLTTWGFTDRYSWIPSYFVGFGEALPFDEAFAPKPAASFVRRERRDR